MIELIGLLCDCIICCHKAGQESAQPERTHYHQPRQYRSATSVPAIVHEPYRYRAATSEPFIVPLSQQQPYFIPIDVLSEPTIVRQPYHLSSHVSVEPSASFQQPSDSYITRL